MFLQKRTRWKLARFSPEANSEPLSILLQNGFRFLHPPIPAPYCIRLTTNLPSAKELYRLTTFRLNNRIGLGAAYIPEELHPCAYSKRTHILSSHLLVNVYHQLSHFRAWRYVNGSSVNFTIPSKPTPFGMLLSVRESCPGSFTPQRYHWRMCR